jgi:hypothetical protein
MNTLYKKPTPIPVGDDADEWRPAAIEQPKPIPVGDNTEGWLPPAG